VQCASLAPSSHREHAFRIDPPFKLQKSVHSVRAPAAVVRQVVTKSAAEVPRAGRQVQLANPAVTRNAPANEWASEPPPLAVKVGASGLQTYANVVLFGIRPLVMERDDRLMGVPGHSKRDFRPVPSWPDPGKLSGRPRIQQSVKSPAARVSDSSTVRFRANRYHVPLPMPPMALGFLQNQLGSCCIPLPQSRGRSEAYHRPRRIGSLL